jgi:quercetin dioxygenase-like cupin family protein
MDKVRLVAWNRESAHGENELLEVLRSEGLKPYRWANNPGDVYAAHKHPYHKIIYVVRGSITFLLPDSNVSLEMNPGDRLELPMGVSHQAIVGPQGVVCLESHV